MEGVNGEFVEDCFTVDSVFAVCVDFGGDGVEIGAGGTVIAVGAKVIGTQAFCGCTALGSVTFSASVEVIGEYAFLACDALKSVAVPSSARVAGNAFGSRTEVTRASPGDYAAAAKAAVAAE